MGRLNPSALCCPVQGLICLQVVVERLGSWIDAWRVGVGKVNNAVELALGKSFRGYRKVDLISIYSWVFNEWLSAPLRSIERWLGNGSGVESWWFWKQLMLCPQQNAHQSQPPYCTANIPITHS